LAYAGDLVNREELRAQLSRTQDSRIIVCGHLHVRDSVACGTLLQLGIGPLVEAPYECAVIDVDVDEDGTVRLTRESVSLETDWPDLTPTALVPPVERWSWRDRAWCRSGAAW
jgi:hypothetical protein